MKRSGASGAISRGGGWWWHDGSGDDVDLVAGPYGPSVQPAEACDGIGGTRADDKGHVDIAVETHIAVKPDPAGGDGDAVTLDEVDAGRPVEPFAIDPQMMAAAADTDHKRAFNDFEIQSGARELDAGGSAECGVPAIEIHRARGGDAVAQGAEASQILDAGQRRGAEDANTGNDTHAAPKRTQSPALSRSGGVASGSKLMKSVRPMTCQPVGIGVAVSAVCPAA